MATAAAAAVAAARRQALAYFFAHNAVTPDLAQPYAPDRRLQRRQFERLQAAGVIREAKPGRYYVDIPAWQAWQGGMKRRVAIVLLGALVVLGVVLAVTLAKGG